jgi:hypothetical protein
MEGVQLVGPPRPWSLPRHVERRHFASLHALAAISRVSACLDDRSRGDRSGGGCPYCSIGLYAAVPVTCPSCSPRPRRLTDEYLEAREAMLRNGLEYFSGGRILSVR